MIKPNPKKNTTKLAPIQRTLLKARIVERMDRDPKFAERVNKMVEEAKKKAIK